MQFYLGTHRTTWLARTDVPLFLSARQLRKRQVHPRASGSWCLDSGAFSEISLNGIWTITPEQYVDEAREWSSSIGKMDWAAQQDLMCEPFILAKTGLTVKDHQRLTVENFLRLKTLAPDIAWIPVVQGWTRKQYHKHVKMFRSAGVRLELEQTVGVGSVCRRQATREAADILHSLADEGLSLHGFGVKQAGLRLAGDDLVSADSMAWSYAARAGRDTYACPQGSVSCANCLHYALAWRERLLASL